MSFRPSTVTVCIAAILGCLLGIITFAGADDPPETYQQILAKRPPPELDALSERSAPDQQGETASESFLDLLKLREAPLRAAVPQLAEILAAHADSTRIHGFAAAQALYCIPAILLGLGLLLLMKSVTHFFLIGRPEDGSDCCPIPERRRMGPIRPILERWRNGFATSLL